MSLEYNEKDFTKKQRLSLYEINAWGYRKSTIMKAYKRDKELAEKQGIPSEVVEKTFRAGKSGKKIVFNKRAKRLKKK